MGPFGFLSPVQRAGGHLEPKSSSLALVQHPKMALGTVP